ncbi:hypothetical protein PYCC9005_001821 [Savitreella phatthalungensis]
MSADCSAMSLPINNRQRYLKRSPSLASALPPPSGFLPLPPPKSLFRRAHTTTSCSLYDSSTSDYPGPPPNIPLPTPPQTPHPTLPPSRAQSSRLANKPSRISVPDIGPAFSLLPIRLSASPEAEAASESRATSPGTGRRDSFSLFPQRPAAGITPASHPISEARTLRLTASPAQKTLSAERKQLKDLLSASHAVLGLLDFCPEYNKALGLSEFADLLKFWRCPCMRRPPNSPANKRSEACLHRPDNRISRSANDLATIGASLRSEPGQSSPADKTRRSSSDLHYSPSVSFIRRNKSSASCSPKWPLSEPHTEHEFHLPDDLIGFINTNLGNDVHLTTRPSKRACVGDRGNWHWAAGQGMHLERLRVGCQWSPRDAAWHALRYLVSATTIDWKTVMSSDDPAFIQAAVERPALRFAWLAWPHAASHLSLRELVILLVTELGAVEWSLTSLWRRLLPWATSGILDSPRFMHRLLSHALVEPEHRIDGGLSLSALPLAAKRGDIEAVNILTSLNTPLDQRYTASGLTALHIAIGAKKIRTAQALVRAGADPWVRDEADRATITLWLRTTRPDFARPLRQADHDDQQSQASEVSREDLVKANARWAAENLEFAELLMVKEGLLPVHLGPRTRVAARDVGNGYLIDYIDGFRRFRGRAVVKSWKDRSMGPFRALWEMFARYTNPPRPNPPRQWSSSSYSSSAAETSSASTPADLPSRSESSPRPMLELPQKLYRLGMSKLTLSEARHELIR